MIELSAPYRRATTDDAKHMAELVNIAGHGLPLYLWARFARPGQSAWDVGLERARTGTGGFAYRNTVVREEAGEVVACLIGYPLSDTSEPVDDDVPAILVPLLELENLVPGTWYINVLAAYPDYRGKGLGTGLLEIAEAEAQACQSKGLSLITSDDNVGARRLYERYGYTERATRPIVKEGWDHAGEQWVLMTRDLARTASNGRSSSATRAPTG